MNRQGRDVVFAAVGVAIVLGSLILVEQLGGGDEPAVAPGWSVGAMPPGLGAGSESAVAVSDAISGSTTTPTVTTTVVSTTVVSATVPTVAETLAIASIVSSESELWEDDEACSARPRTAVVTATVVGPNQVVGAVLGWAVDGPEFEMQWVEMVELGSGIYSVEVGPFDPDSVAAGSAEAILMAVEVADAADEGAYDDSSLVLLLHDCEPGS